MKIQRIRDNAILPEYQTDGAAGFDFHAANEQPLLIKSGKAVTVPTGIAVEIPRGYELQVRARSGLAFKYNIGLVNGVGTIDSDFRVEISIRLINLGSEDFIIEPDMRIAQGVVAKYERINWQEVDKLSETTRGAAGFGSTGQ